MTANLLNVPLLELNFSKIMGSLVGQSERAIDQALSVVKACAPCVLLCDEAEKALGGYVSSAASDSGTLARVMGRLLSFMQDNDNGVFIIMTSNDISKLPPELLRSGRLDTQWYFGLPSATERESIFNIYLNKKNKTLSPKLMDAAVKATNNFTGAEIKATVENMMRKLWSRYKQDNTIDTSTFIKEDILLSVDEVVPVYRSSADVVTGLQHYAETRALFASEPDRQSNTITNSIDISF
jgi:SpoVK/Ycf46/Vps4 family AAA+-type ATPase